MPNGRFHIVNVRIFDGTGSAPTPGEALIEGDRIVEVALGGATIETSDAKVIDGRGGTLMPGLVEAHAHITWLSSIGRLFRQRRLPVEELAFVAARNARILLDHGFTSAYSAGALADRLEVALRNEIRDGWIPGPRLIASTIERGPGAEGGYKGDGSEARLRGPQALYDYVTQCAEMGIDSVKLLISGEDALAPGASQNVLYDEAEIRAAGEAARAHNIWLAAHTQAAESIKIALRGGVRVLYHCSWADEEALDMLEAARDEVFVAPAIGVIVATLEATPPPTFDMTAMKEAAKPVIEQTQRLIPELRRRGVRVLPGGDYGFAFNPNGRNARDLEHFVTLYGYTPAEALQSATQLGGQIMGMGDELGLVRAGYRADLLIVDGDPTQDVAILQDADRLTMIMTDGKLYKHSAIASAPSQLAA